MPNGILAEVCCGSADDVERAAAAGADRAELNCALCAGGLTPTPGMLAAALSRAQLPVICMLRPRAGGFCYSDAEFDTMVRDARALRDAGAAGFAFGCLTADGRIDEPRCARLVRAAGGAQTVFHRAFDVLRGAPEDDIETLVRLGFSRVLTSGRQPAAPDGADCIRRCVACARGRIEILAGGGVRPHNAAALARDTGVRQLHFTCHTARSDPSAAGAAVSFAAPGAGAPDAVAVVDGDALRSFVALLHAL
ncbi:MAG: copper homeostasis protein CutC [Oscillospiraceae bacterium]|nr:copper homeostasis protein CutC [Oscillospiraceae bacterium]